MRQISLVLLTLIVSFSAQAVIDVKNANYSDSWIDIIAPGTGFDLRIQRTYNSRTLFNGMLGFGWCSDFETKIAVKNPSGLFAEGNVMTFTAVITDLAGNQTTGTARSMIVDQVAPTAGTVSTIETEASNPLNNVDGYWNKHNTGLPLTVPLPDDPSLLDGEIRIIGKKSTTNTWQEIGNYSYDASYDINQTELTALESIVPSSLTLLKDIESPECGYDCNGDGVIDALDQYTWVDGVEEMNDFAELISLAFSARVFDVAGNYTNWSYGNSVLAVDTTSPVILNVASPDLDGAYKEGDVIYISVVANEDIRSVGSGSENSTLELAVGGGTGGANPTIPFRSTSNDTVYYTYIVGAGESSEDTDPLVTTADNLNYAATTSLVLDADDGILTDLAGNNLGNVVAPATDFWPNLPALDDANALAKLKNIIIDTDAPGVTFTYFETATAVTDSSDSLVSVNDVKLIIHAAFTDSIQIDSIPTLAINFPVGPGNDNTIGDISSAAMTRIGSWKYKYELTLIDSVNGNLNVTPTAYDKAGNLIDQSAAVSSVIRMDNVHPVFTLLSPDSNSFVNSRKVSYQLSEDVFSGKIIWKWESGNADLFTPHEQILDATELLQNPNIPYENMTLIDDPENLVDGAKYTIYWSAVDSADNPSVSDNDGNSIYASTTVLYDTTGPNVDLTYSLYVAGGGYTDTITATFNERIWPAPQITIDFPPEGASEEDIATQVAMSIDSTSGPDSTVWFYEALIPDREANNGTTFVQITANDLAGNPLLPANINANDTLVVDNSPPSVTISYVNLNLPWLTNEGKGTHLPIREIFRDTIEVIARMSEKFDPFPYPQLNIQYADSTSDNIDSLETGVSSNSDSTFTWTIALPDSVKNTGTMTVSLNARDRAKNLIPESGYSGHLDFTVDNTFPDTVTTGNATAYAAEGLPQPNPGWINYLTDSIVVIVPIPTPNEDETLFLNSKGGLHIELRNKNRGTAGWVNIPKAQEPFADSLAEGGPELKFYRTMDEIFAVMENEVDLVQGDSIYIRAALSDRVGNKTYGDSSATIFSYDPYRPTVSDINGGNAYTVDTLISQDYLSASWTGSTDSTWQAPPPSSQTYPGSGILEYEYRIMIHDSLGFSDPIRDTLVNWTGVGLDCRRVLFLSRSGAGYLESCMTGWGPPLPPSDTGYGPASHWSEIGRASCRERG